MAPSPVYRTRGRGRRAAVPPPSPPPELEDDTVLLPNPLEAEMEEAMDNVVHQSNRDIRPTNTMLALDPKVAEFIEFCELVYPREQVPARITYSKVYRFMFYQTFREKKKGRRKGGPRFNLEEYNDRMGLLRTAGSAVQLEHIPLPKQPTGLEVFKQYRTALKQLFNRQIQQGIQSTNGWEHIWQVSLKMLEKHVQLRKVAVMRANFEEKYPSEFAPYAVVDRYDDIEALMFHKANVTRVRSMLSAIRNRYCLLMLTSGILRCESLYRAELSDLFHLDHPKSESDVHQPFLLVLQLLDGKANKGKRLYGRSTRHSNPKLCSVGALAFYLQLRFRLTEEFRNFSLDDWLDNSKWFKVKLLVDIQSHDYEKEMKNNCYGKAIEKVLTELGIMCRGSLSSRTQAGY